MLNAIKEHLARYPKMQIQDAAKLLYQSEFGGGHMIVNPEMSLKRIQNEYDSLQPEIQSQSMAIEPIGNNMYRIYLSALSRGLSAEVLNEMFVQSANHKKGNILEFEKKLNLLLTACEDNILPFSKTEVYDFLADWKSNGYPAISHSSIYRDTYQPAYRVVEAHYAPTCNLILKISQLQQTADFQFAYINAADTLSNTASFTDEPSCQNVPYIIAIDGMSSSGKTTLGNLLHKNFPNSNLFHMDDYFLQPHQRTKERLAEIGGNVDYERFKTEILDSLADRNGLTYQKYNCRTQNLEPEMTVPWKPLVIIEGAYSQHPYFQNPYLFHLICILHTCQQYFQLKLVSFHMNS